MNLRTKAISQLVLGLKAKTGQDYSQQVTQMIDEEMNLLYEIARLIPNQQAVQSVIPRLSVHRDASARFFASVLKNNRLGYAIQNNLNKYFDSWLRLIYAHKYLLANRLKLEDFFLKNLQVAVPLTQLHIAVENDALKRNTPTKPLTPRQEGG